MSYRIQRHPDAAAFLRRAEAWLLQAEAEHNLLLGIAYRLAASAEDPAQEIYLATVEDADGVAGCAFRTPPYKLGLTRMPEAALPLLVEDVAGVYDALPAVLGPMPQVQRFAEGWSRRHGVHTRPGLRQRIYQLDEVIPPPRMPPGRLRAATPTDADLTAQWLTDFNAETHMHGPDPRAFAGERIAHGALYFWDDDGPVSMAGWTARTPHGARIGYVYTPPALRGRGYASACVATLSRHLLGTGLSCCFLYTDRSNPTSNRIYQHIGYRPVCDVMDYDFEVSPSKHPGPPDAPGR